MHQVPAYAAGNFRLLARHRNCYNNGVFGGSVTALVIGACFGIIGFSLFLYGKKSQEMKPMAIGIALMVYPYFVSSVLWSVLIGIGLIACMWWPQ